MSEYVQAPEKLVALDNSQWELVKRKRKNSSSLYFEYKSEFLSYKNIDNQDILMTYSTLVEKEYTKKQRPEPISPIITQNRWDCGPAALAMLLGESFREVKQACVFSGWNNDDEGIYDYQIIQASALLGHIVKSTKDWNDLNQSCLLTVNSLNFKGRYHAVCWNGFEILDPNYKNLKRFSYGPDWEPITINAKERKFVLIK